MKNYERDTPGLQDHSLLVHLSQFCRKNIKTYSRLEQSRSHRILWLLEELQLKYELKTFKRRSDKSAPPELKKVHPLGKSPIITIEAPGSSSPLMLAESGAMVEYLCDHFGPARPTLVPGRYLPGREGQVGGEREEWMRYRYFMHYAEGSLMPFLVMTLVNDSKLVSLPNATLYSPSRIAPFVTCADLTDIAKQLSETPLHALSD